MLFVMLYSSSLVECILVVIKLQLNFQVIRFFTYTFSCVYSAYLSYS